MATPSPANFHARLSDADDQIAAGDYKAAEDSIDRADTMLAGLADSTGPAGVSVSWGRDQISQLRARIQRRRSSKAGLQTSNVKFEKPGTD